MLDVTFHNHRSRARVVEVCLPYRCTCSNAPQSRAISILRTRIAFSVSWSCARCEARGFCLRLVAGWHHATAQRVGVCVSPREWSRPPTHLDPVLLPFHGTPIFAVGHLRNLLFAAVASHSTAPCFLAGGGCDKPVILVFCQAGRLCVRVCLC